jgi:NAD(P)-dependent dehydrogenase (short-subunit alcohol dehydrogenase family)
MRMKGQVAVVIGAGGGMGAAICHAFVREGAKVAGADLSEDRLDHLRLGDDGILLAVDATDAASLDTLHKQVQARLGTPAVLVNCLGIWHSTDYDAVTAEDWRRVLDGNLTSVWLACQAFLPGMAARGHGSVINFASTAGEYGSIRPAAHYAAAKGGIIAMTKSLAREVSPRGVRINVISPGPVDTPMLAPADETQRAQIAARTLVGRLGTPDDIAEAALYLGCADSGFVTGHVLRVNGGALV